MAKEPRTQVSGKEACPIFNYLKVMRRHADVAIRRIIDALNEKGDAAAPPMIEST